MKFIPLPLDGAYLIEPEPHEDERGSFARTWCVREFAAHGLVATVAQCSTSFNRRRGTMRGMHYQVAPHGEVKVVRATRGAIHDVIVDLRPDSPTYLHSYGTRLDENNRHSLYIPEGCAHGFLTLEDNSEVFYQISQFYEPSASRGVRWNDPAFKIPWPGSVRVISERDESYPDFRPEGMVQ